MSEYGVVVLPNTSMALKAEKTLQIAGFEIKAIPTPRQFSSDCGIAVRFSWENETQVRQVLVDQRVDFNGIYKML